MRLASIGLMLVGLSACSGSTGDHEGDREGPQESNLSQRVTPSAPAAFERRGIEIVDAGTQFECTPVRVWDGDGPIWCKEGMRVRLAGIAAREIDETCRDGHPCPAAGGVEARDVLVELIGVPVGTSPEGHILVTGGPLSCYSEGRALGTRTSAWCVSSTYGDLSCEMIGRNAALRWDKYWGEHKCEG